MEKEQQPQKQIFCEECKANPSKYKCPGCSLRTCSLPCVKAHKQRTSCSGKRNRTLFVPLSQFDDNLLLSDYNLLEETKRVAESAQRTRMQLRAYSQKLPYYLRNLRTAAAKRKTRLLLLPSGMHRREKNQTRYDQRKKFISWTIEWRFHPIDVVLLDHGVHEDTSLCTLIEKHLKPGPKNHQLRQFREEHLDSLKFFICKYPKGPKSPFVELDIKAPLKQQLVDVVILEYPVFHVFLPSQKYDFDVVKVVHSAPHRPETEICNDHPMPKGVVFREEEIEEDNGSLDKVYDLTNNAILSPPSQIKHHDNIGRTLYNFPGGPLLTKAGEGSISSSSAKTVEPGIFDDTEFDLDQGLLDAYTDLMSQINPDDFLDLDGAISKEAEGKDFLDSGDFFLNENELEEGEILE